MANSPAEGNSADSEAALAATLSGLALASTRLHPDDVADAVSQHAGKLGLSRVVIYLSDLEQRLLVPFSSPPGDDLEPLAIDGTVAGRAYRTERSVVAPAGEDSGESGSGGTVVWMPLLDSAERYGVVSLHMEGDVGEHRLEQCSAMTNLVAEIIANKSVYGDSIALARRTQDVSLAAEMRWTMLPPLTFTGRNLTISGLVEPAYTIAGDTFDYAVNGDTAHVAIIDAVGHGLEAARIANLTVSAYRHSRRLGHDHIDTYLAMDAVLADQFGWEKFATAQLAALTLSTGKLRWLNAGHPAPMVLRQGHRVDLSSDACLPVGLAGSGELQPTLAETGLEPGDLVLFFSDGVVEARSASGEDFGRERLADLLERASAAGQTPAETMRLLGHAVLDHQEGVLQDDATLLVLAWHGPPL